MMGLIEHRAVEEVEELRKQVTGNVATAVFMSNM